MGQLAKAAERQRDAHKRRHIVDLILDRLDDEDRADLLDLLADSTFSDRKLSATLAECGHMVSESSIRNWRVRNEAR